jgi:hypothetical protein
MPGFGHVSDGILASHAPFVYYTKPTLNLWERWVLKGLG